MSEAANEAMRLISQAIEELRDPTFETVEIAVKLLTDAVDRLAVGGKSNVP